MASAGARAGRRAQERERIDYAFVDTAVGRLMAAFSERGIVWLAFAESDVHALEELANHFPKAELVVAGAERDRWISSVVGAVESPRQGRPGLPLDLRGTEFQLAVWEALLAIPPGETRSYGDVARSIGHPAAFRAAGQACGANPVVVLVPCHRVLGSDGSLHGFTSGLDRKRVLLEREGWKPARA